jgi:hypothetical protein
MNGLVQVNGFGELFDLGLLLCELKLVVFLIQVCVGQYHIPRVVVGIDINYVYIYLLIKQAYYTCTI